MDAGKTRAGREGKPPQMKILNQHALPLQLRPRWGLRLIYSLKPGNQAIKRNQTLRFPALNGPAVGCGQLGIPVNSFEAAMNRCRPRPFGVRTMGATSVSVCLVDAGIPSSALLKAPDHGIKGSRPLSNLLK